MRGKFEVCLVFTNGWDLEKGAYGDLRGVLICTQLTTGLGLKYVWLTLLCEGWFAI